MPLLVMNEPHKQTSDQAIDMGLFEAVRLLLRIAVVRTMMFLGRLTRLLVILGW
jgi:hypothetical protein